MEEKTENNPEIIFTDGVDGENLNKQLSLANKTFELTKRIQQCGEQITKVRLERGFWLYMIREEELWRYHAEGICNFDDYLKDIGISHTSAYQDIGIAEVFGSVLRNDNNLASIEYTKLVRLTPILRKEDEQIKKEWLSDSLEMPLKDVYIKIREHKKLPTPEDCLDDIIVCKEPKEYIVKCLTCGKMQKIGITEVRKLDAKGDI